MNIIKALARKALFAPVSDAVSQGATRIEGDSTAPNGRDHPKDIVAMLDAMDAFETFEDKGIILQVADRLETDGYVLAAQAARDWHAGKRPTV